MFARLRDLLTGFLVVALAFGIVDWALRRAAPATSPPDTVPDATVPPVEPVEPVAPTATAEIA
ncbi:MAG: hypothetical protein ACR2N6_05250, partial [Miltoncostaeaceae bacterium]